MRIAFRLVAVVLAGSASAVFAAPPVYDHVVIVIEENHSFQSVIGNPTAPYMNQLAAQGRLTTNMWGMVHPSQPNYIHFFSGENQGIGDNAMPVGIPFSTPNLGAALIAAGRTFVGYSEDLPAVGSQIETTGGSGYYRKHNPWANWQNDPPVPNQLSSSVNRPFTDFPTDFTQLPTVSVVVPNQLHDMHDGTIAQADVWLQQNLATYANWCVNNNSLLIVTWDEDSFAAHNQIPTIFYGAGVRVGTDASCWTLHNLARTIGDMYGATPPGQCANVSAMEGVFIADPVVTPISFRNGESGYAGAVDTMLDSANPNTNHSATALLVSDGSPMTQSLVRFGGIFGTAANGRIPLSARIVSAKVSCLTGAGSTDNSVNTMAAHRMLVPWTDSSTYASLIGGVSTNGVEAAEVSTFSFQPRNSNTAANVFVQFDVTASLRQMQTAGGENANFGWLWQPSGTDGWRWLSSETPAVADRPRLDVTLDLTPCTPTITGPTCSFRPGPNDAGVYCFNAATPGGVAAITYQWFRDGTPIVDTPGVYQGASTGSLTLLSPTCADNGAVLTCVVTTECGSATSPAMTVSFLPADLGQQGGIPGADGVHDNNDFVVFINYFFGGDLRADLGIQGGGAGHDGLLDNNDFVAFINAFFAGCG